MKKASILIMIAVVFLNSACVEQINSENGEFDILAGLESTLPESWHYARICDVDSVNLPVGLTAPKQVFRIYKDELPQPADTLSILLFFYEIAQKAVIDSIIQEQAIYSWCIPMAFAESTEYYVITSPCHIHSSSVFERGSEVESVVSLVKEHIEKQL